MYVSHKGSRSVTRPVQGVEGVCARVVGRWSMTKTVTLPLSAKGLAYWDESEEERLWWRRIVWRW